MNNVSGAGYVAEDVPSIASITFSNGTKVPIRNNSVVVFCGPNNAGKSASLKEIRLQIAEDLEFPKVIKSIQLDVPFNNEQMKRRLADTAQYVEKRYGINSYQGVGYSVDFMSVDIAFRNENKKMGALSDYWCVTLPTKDRIGDSDPAESVPVLRSAPQHPIHTLQADKNIEDTMSAYFVRAFGKELILHLGAGAEVPLYVGENPELELGEHRLSASYIRRLEERAVPLSDQGDGMRSFATVMLRSRALTIPAFLFVDEPEAFLHPPQARLIGEFLVKERRKGLQTFVATHSSDVIRGMLSSKDDNLIIIRIDRVDDKTRVSVLDNELALQIANEPLTKYTNILDSLFQARVVACEADADSAFYNLISDALLAGSSRDVLFTHGNGKSSLAKIARALKALGAGTDVIVDIDVLNDEVVFRAIFSALGGNWAAVELQFRRFKSLVENRSNFLKVGDVKQEVEGALSGLAERDALTIAARKKIADAIKQSSPWDSLKGGGRAAIPSGQAIADFDLLAAESRRVGLWIVPVGELESFCKNPHGGHGPSWLRNVLENYDLLESRELREAREFIQALLGSKT